MLGYFYFKVIFSDSKDNTDSKYVRRKQEKNDLCYLPFDIFHDLISSEGGG